MKRPERKTLEGRLSSIENAVEEGERRRSEGDGGLVDVERIAEILRIMEETLGEQGLRRWLAETGITVDEELLRWFGEMGLAVGKRCDAPHAD